MKKIEKRSILAGLYGNALEWFDFLLYASFAPLFAILFFPTDVKYVSLMATFGVFAIGFLMRPIGGIIIGHYADFHGRRQALILSVTIMTLATGSIAFLPSYQQIGLISPLLFTILRLIQGIAVGGELPGSATFIIEHMFADRRGFAGSLVLSTAFFGIFMGSLVASSISHLLSYEDLLQFGWRVAYVLGSLLGVIGIYLRIKSAEPSQYLNIKPSNELPAKQVFTQHKQSLLLAVIFTSIMALSNYVLIAYLPTFLVNANYLPLRDAHTINLIALLLLTLLIPIMGLLSDLIGRKPVFLGGLCFLLIGIFPVFWLLQQGSWWPALLGEVILSLVLAPLNGTVPTILAEMFPTTVRASGTSIGYNLGQALFGGTVPLIALTLVEITGNHYAPAWYVFLWAIFVILSMRFLQESYKTILA